ncbi:TPA: HAD family phosphatase [Candidatus Poribacteria bacterium]|nr:HAD family phosphatase [Candidatus Poribacteria bacterium]HEX30423.1 HAD family phosphatase [Candidatus Poribacteria bacterium]
MRGLKLIAIDLDGTLLYDDGTLSERNAEAISKALSLGVEIVLASGRMFRTILPYARRLNLTGPIIAYNGALAKVISTGEVLSHTPIPPEIADEIVDHCLSRELHLNFYLNERVYVQHINKWSRLYDTRTGSRSKRVDLARLKGSAPTKLLVIDHPSRIRGLVEEFRSLLDNRLYFLVTMPEYIEFMNKEVSKGRALRDIMNRFGVSRQEVAVIGDGNNDLPMMEEAGVKVAMGNATDKLKCMADYVVGSNEEDGVAEAIEILTRLHLSRPLPSSRPVS